MEKTLNSKICLVTGASRGIGRTITEKFAEQAAIVYANALEENNIDEWARQCSQRYNTRVIPVYFDVTDSVAMKNALMKIYKEEGRIDCLVNNAAIISNQKIGMITRNNLERMFQVNVYAVIEIIQIISRLMAKNNGGSIINIASITGVIGAPGQLAYSATKGAVITITKSAAKELADQYIRVNAVAPGIVKTERFDELYAANGHCIENRIEKIALRRLGTPVDIANACVFFASDNSDYITGQILGVDGCATI